MSEGVALGGSGGDVALVTPAEYEHLISEFAGKDEDVKMLLSLVHILRGYSTIPALMKNFKALRRVSDEEAMRKCKALTKELRKRGVLWRGFYDEFVSPEGFEEVFERVVSAFVHEVVRKRPLKDFFEECKAKKDTAALKMLELLLKVPLQERGATQYEMLRADISDMFSPAKFLELEERFIAEGICIYGKKARREFLELRHSEAEKISLRDAMLEYRQEVLSTRAEEVERAVGGMLNEMKENSELVKSLASQMNVPAESKMLKKLIGDFSGFSMDDTFFFLTASFSIFSNFLVVVLTDTLSRYDVREWRTYPDPTLFLVEEMPRWVKDIESVFKDAYPPLSERKIAIASLKTKEAFANYESDALSIFLERLGISEIQPFPK